MYPLIADPSEYGEGTEGLDGALSEFTQEYMADPKAYDMYAVKKRYRVTEGRRKFERKNGLKKRMWRREMNKRLEPIVKTFGNMTEEDEEFYHPTPPPSLISFDDYENRAGRFGEDKDPDFQE